MGTCRMAVLYGGEVDFVFPFISLRSQGNELVPCVVTD